MAEPETHLYGDGGTWHQTQNLNVETKHGRVVAVWFRCMALPFDQTEVSTARAEEMERMYQEASIPKLHAVKVEKQ